jgi:hypothetical protein
VRRLTTNRAEVMKGQAGEVSHQPSLRHVLALEGVGLITVERTDGRAARVTLLDEPSVGLRRRRSGYLRLISLGADEERVSAARRGLRSGDHLARAVTPVSCRRPS